MKRFTLISTLAIALIGTVALTKQVWDPPPPWRVPQALDLSAPPSYYYIDFVRDKYIFLRDAAQLSGDGIPPFFHDDTQFFHPVFVSQFALGAYDFYLNTHDEAARRRFLKCADALVAKLRRHGRFLYWEYGFANTGYPGGSGIPWFSAMAQGQGASVLLRAYRATGDPTYLTAAAEALESLYADVSAGGISVVHGSDYVFPQEYPTSPPSNILNGALFAYFGVYDFYRVTDDERSRHLATVIAQTVGRRLAEFDTGYWSRYALWPSGLLAGPRYHSLHVAQLRVLFRITNDSTFRTYAERFAQYQARWENRMRYLIIHYSRRASHYARRAQR